MINEVKIPGKLGKTHYIPHDHVIWDDKNTTKILIAFDASDYYSVVPQFRSKHAEIRLFK